jgi:hypothetical protein
MVEVKAAPPSKTVTWPVLICLPLVPGARWDPLAMPSEYPAKVKDSHVPHMIQQVVDFERVDIETSVRDFRCVDESP